MLWCRRLLIILVIGAGLSGWSPAHAADPAQELLDRYAPIVASPLQTEACGDGEPYTPMAVDALFGRDDVVLRDANGAPIMTSPSPSDLVAAGPTAHLDIPGNALDPGCDYERWFRGLDTTPAVYGRVATDSQEPGRLAVQYWFYWAYNDWNDRHEGDWEMVQLVFDASTAAEALTIEPTTMIVAQHEGGEMQPWAGVSMRDGKPVVFPGAGSHASYFSPNRWFGKSAQSGFGCDDTRSPSTVVEPVVIRLPDIVPSDPADPFAWLAWQGHWGEQQPSFNNGPTGPITKAQWEHPIRWMDDEGRAGSVSLPPMGTGVTNFFCSASQSGSLLFLRFLNEPWLVVITAVLAVGIVVWAVRRTAWTPSQPLPIRMRRKTGEMWVAGFRFLRTRWWRLVPFMAMLFLTGALARGLQRLVFAATGAGEVSDVLGERSTFAVGLALFCGALVGIPVFTLVVASLVRLVQDEANEAESLSTGQLVRESLRPRRYWPTFAQVALLLVSPLFPLLTVYFVARWMVAAGCVPDRHPFARSAQLTKGHRWRTLVVGTVAISFAIGTGLLLGTVLLLVTPASFWVVNLIASITAAILVPWAIVVLCYLQADLELALDAPVPDAQQAPTPAV